MSDKDIRFFFSGEDKASAIFDKVGGRAVRLGKKMKSIGADVAKLSADVYAATTAVLKYANSWGDLESSMESASNQMASATQRLLGMLGDKFEQEKARIGTIIDPVEQEAALQAMLDQTQAKLEQAVAKYQAAQQDVEDIQSSWYEGIPIIGQNFAEATQIAKEGAKEIAGEIDKQVQQLQDQRDELRKMLSEETKLQKQREEAFQKNKQGEAYLDQLRDQVDAVSMSKEAYADLQAQKNTANAEQLETARGLLAERDAIIAANEAREQAKATIQSWRDAVVKAYTDAMQAQKDAMKAAADEQAAQQQKRDELYQDSINNITRERIAFEQGEEAARKYELGLAGLDEQRAAEIARLEEKLRRDKEAAEGVPSSTRQVGQLTAREGRLLTGRGVTVDYTKQTAEESKKSSKLLDSLVKQGAEVLGELKKLAFPDVQGV